MGIAVLLSVLLVQAQPPERPELKGLGDPKDWNAYYDQGVDLLRRQPANAEAHFYWASRLAPNRAEPLYPLGRLLDHPVQIRGHQKGCEPC